MSRETVKRSRKADELRTDREVALSVIEENRRLRELVRGYARHHDWCAEWPEMDQPCDCGFVESMSDSGPEMSDE